MATLVDIAARITRNATVLQNSLDAHHITQPSFNQARITDLDGLSNKDHDASEAREALIDDTKLLNALLQGPSEIIHKVSTSSFDLAAQSIIYHFKMYEAVPLNGTITYETLAKKVGIPEHRVRLVIRISAMSHIFDEPTPGKVTHTAASRMLVENKSTLAWYGHFLDEVFPSAASLADAQKKFENSDAANHCAFSHAFKTDEPIFSFFEKRPDRQARFFGAMAGVGRTPQYSLDNIVKGYNWDKLGNATIVDIGGSAGFVSIVLAEAYPNLKFVVQDYENTVQGGKKELPNHLVKRFEWVAHDFFTPQPTVGDVYILRHICHDWNKANSIKILKSLVPALKPSSKIVLVESVVKPPGTYHTTHDRHQRSMEMTMWTMVNAQERTEEEWEEVVRETDPRLAILSINRPGNSADSLIEIGFKDPASVIPN